MKIHLFVALAVSAWILGVFSAYNAPAGYFSYIQVNTTSPSTIALGYSLNYSGTIALMTAQQYANFKNGSSYTSIYAANVSAGSYVKPINVGPGSYYVTISGSSPDGSSHAINYTLDSFTAPEGQIKSINFSYEYALPVTLQNYSSITLKYISNTALNVIFPNTIYNNFSISSNATSHINYTWLTNRGAYNLSVTAPGNSEMLLYTNSTPVLVNPLNQSIYNMSSLSSLPIGIASYGLSNSTGNLGPYQIKTNGVAGIARLNSASAYNAMPGAGISKNGMSLQLNAELNIVSKGKTYIYWLQNVVQLNTSNMSYDLLSNIWNNTAKNANISNATVSGNGYVSLSNGTKNASAYYAYATNSTPYSYPLIFSPVMLIQYYSGKPVVSFGVAEGSDVYYFDNVTFNITSDNASFLLTPYYTAPSGNFYDFEFVFGGEGNGSATTFNKMSSNLWLYYDSNGTPIQVPTAYTFGSDTVESATNLRTLQNVSGAFVTPGKVDKNQVIYASGAPSNATFANATFVVPPTTASAPNSTPAGAGYNSSISASNTINTSVHTIAVQLLQNSQQPFPVITIAILALVLVLVLIILIIMLRNRRRTRGNNLETVQHHMQ